MFAFYIQGSFIKIWCFISFSSFLSIKFPLETRKILWVRLKLFGAQKHRKLTGFFSMIFCTFNHTKLYQDFSSLWHSLSSSPKTILLTIFFLYLLAISTYNTMWRSSCRATTSLLGQHLFPFVFSCLFSLQIIINMPA